MTAVLHKDQFAPFTKNGVKSVEPIDNRNLLQMYLWGAKNCDSAIVEKLISLGVDVHHRTNSGKSVMYYAATNLANTLEIIEILLNEGADWQDCFEGKDVCSVYRMSCR